MVVLVGLILRVVPVAPVFQETLPDAVAVNVTGAFAQTLDSLATTLIEGKGVTFTVVVATFVQPCALVPTTV